MNFARAFTYVFEDQEWPRKVLIPALIAIIPVIGQIFLLGWSLEIARRIIQQNPVPLPELDFGQQLIEGLKGMVVGIVYSLPVILFVIPITIVSAMLGGNANGNMPNAPIFLVSICCGGLIFLYAILMTFAIPAAYGNMAAKDSLGAAFNFSEVIGLLCAAPGAYLLTLLGLIISGIIGSLGSVVCGIGIVVTLTYSMTINGHLFGQAYNEATRNSGYARVY
jgi:Protein of unknown function (DUF4013)